MINIVVIMELAYGANQIEDIKNLKKEKDTNLI